MCPAGGARLPGRDLRVVGSCREHSLREHTLRADFLSDFLSGRLSHELSRPAIFLRANALGLNLADISMGLQTFHPTPGQLPGRVNLIEADGVRCLIDYGHNVPALTALEPLVRGLKGKKRIAVASAPGNRRDEDLMGLGAQIAKMVDALFVCDNDPRGREVGEAAGLVRRGAAEAAENCKVDIVLEEHEAVGRAMDAASEGDLLVLLVDDIEGTIQRLKGRTFRTPAPMPA